MHELDLSKLLACHVMQGPVFQKEIIQPISLIKY